MAVEMARKCGYRKVGGLYLMGSGLARVCDRLPLPISSCPVCGEEIRFHRALAKVSPRRRWADHEHCECPENCPMCYPGERGWQMWVGSDYSPASFVAEADGMGVSKRIARLPRDCKIGDWVYLAHQAAIPPQSQEGVPLFVSESKAEAARGYTPGIFYVFAVRGVEKIVTESQAQDAAKMDELRAAGITPVVVPDGDPDHAPRRKDHAKAARILA